MEEEEKELKDELKKNPEFMEFWGKYNKIREEIALLDLQLLGIKKGIELEQHFSSEEIDLINKWKTLSEHPIAKKLPVIQLAKTIILDKIRTKDRLYDEMRGLQLQMFDTIGIFKEKEKVVEVPKYEIVEEDEEDIEKVKKKYFKMNEEGDKEVDRIFVGTKSGISRINKDNPSFKEKLLKIETEGFNRFKKEISKKSNKKEIKGNKSEIKKKTELPKNELPIKDE